MTARLRTTASVLFVVLAVISSGCGGIETLSTREALERLNIATTKLYAADGTLIADLHGEINRDIVSLDDIPKHVQDAAIAVEDRRFWTHGGIDVKAILRAAVRNAAGDDERVEGGSTLSQQLVKNLYFPEPERTVKRKVAEARLTVEFERKYSKDKILEMYLNTVYFGRGVYGIDTAAESYFRKDPKDLSVEEAAFLAGVIHEPARYQWSEDDPPEKQDERQSSAEARRNEVLDDMVELGALTRTEAEEAVEVELKVEPAKESRWKYPYFSDMALRELGVLNSNGGSGSLDPRFDFLGDTFEERAKSVYRGGLRIYTTVEPKAQEAAEEAVAEILPEDLDRLSAATASVEPGTGFVRALVGGKNYYPEGCADEPPEETSRACKLGKVNLALGTAGGGSGRQPGSSFKTFVLAAALENGVSLRRSFSASPFTHELPAGEWKVRNYEGSGGGSISVVDATVRSVNAAYARLEVHGIGEGDALAGSKKVAETARALGISFPTRESIKEKCGDKYGYTGACTAADDVPAIALGAKEVSPLEMAGAYAALANDGRWARPTSIVKITDASGKVLYEADPETRQAVPKGVARGVTHVLRQVIQRGTGTAARLDRPTAGKTGTSQMWRDAWFAGYVPQLAAVVWVGNPIPVKNRSGNWEPESMTSANGYPGRIAGGTYPARIWRAYMDAALEDVDEESFPPPPDEFFIYQSGSDDESDTDDLDTNDTEPGEPSEPSDDHEAPTFVDGHRGGRSGSGNTSSGGSVPSVIGMSPGGASSTLSRAGYNPNGVRQCGGGGEGLRVWSQSPGGGASAPRGSTVTYYYNPAVC